MVSTSPSSVMGIIALIVYWRGGKVYISSSGSLAEADHKIIRIIGAWVVVMSRGRLDILVWWRLRNEVASSVLGVVSVIVSIGVKGIFVIKENAPAFLPGHLYVLSNK